MRLSVHIKRRFLKRRPVFVLGGLKSSIYLPRSLPGWD